MTPTSSSRLTWLFSSVAIICFAIIAGGLARQDESHSDDRRWTIDMEGRYGSQHGSSFV